MGNPYFKFKQFTIHQQHAAMKVGADAVLLGAWADLGNSAKILDIGTGTGLLSLMLAQKSQALITAIEIDADSAKQAAENFNHSSWQNQIELINTALQDFISVCTHKFDFIICNPPFYNSTLKTPDVQRNLARHDQSLNLQDLFFGVSNLLSGNGKFVMIYPSNRKDEVLSIALQQRLFANRMLEIRGNDLKLPNRLIFEFSRKESNIRFSELTIRKVGTNDYTNEYKELTKEYYLNF